MNALRSDKRIALIVAGAIAAVLVGGIGGLLTDLGDWYVALDKPAWQPPDYLFAPVWTTIFALFGGAAAVAWLNSESVAQKQSVLIVILLNLTLNLLWSLLFFRLQRPDWAMIEVAFLWASIVLVIYVFAQRSRLGAWLQAPYLAWVSFAAVLNAEIVRLNGPFAGST